MVVKKMINLPLIFSGLSGLECRLKRDRFDLTVESNNEDAVNLATCKSWVTEAGYQPDSKRQPHSHLRNCL